MRRVPIVGIRYSTGRNVPAIEPSVESAYSRPATAPASAMSVTASRIAHGETAPSAVTGSANISSVPTNEATNAPAETSSNAFAAASNSGRVANGRIAIVTAANSTTKPSVRSSGYLSASRPPSQ